MIIKGLWNNNVPKHIMLPRKRETQREEGGMERNREKKTKQTETERER